MGILQYDRKKFFDGVGTQIKEDEQHSLNEVIELSGLDYIVEKVKSYDADGEEIGSYHTRYFDKNGVKHNLGAGLKEQYTVLQNYEAFDFLNDMLGKDVRVECAGATHGGNQTFICVSTEPMKILDDDISPYIIFQNSYDGSGSIKALLTPIRVFCSNCMAIATRKAVNKITIKHSKNVQQNLYLAKDVLLKNTNYLESIKGEMEELATMRFTRRQFVDNLTVKVLQYMGLYDADGQPIEKKRNGGLAESYRDAMLAAWSANDTKNYQDTAYNAILAMTDFESHRQYARNNDNPETRFRAIVGGLTLSDFALQYIKETATPVIAR